MSYLDVAPPAQLDGATRLYPIIGDPIRYVQSPATLTRTFTARGHHGICIPWQVSATHLDPAMTALTQAGNVDGLLVTMPHKNTALLHCATASERARTLGAVSVMRRNSDHSWHGDILDGLAFCRAQLQRGAVLRGQRALLLGAGGAGSAIALALVQAGVAQLVVHDRDPARAASLVVALAPLTASVSVGAGDPTGFDLVFNATSVGMSDGDASPVDPARLRASMFVGDVIAGHGVTALVAAARQAGCGTATGDDMVEAVQELMADFFTTFDVDPDASPHTTGDGV